MARLTAQTGHTLDLPGCHLTFGSAPECDIPLSGVYGLAPLHFEIAPSTEGISFLRDASGGPGTFVNGQAVNVVQLNDGDVIQAGGLALRFSGTPPAPGLSGRAGIASAPEIPLSPSLRGIPASPSSPLSMSGPPPAAVRLPQDGEIVTGESVDPPAQTEFFHDHSPGSGPGSPEPLLFPRPRTVRRSFSIPFGVRVACVILLGASGAIFCATETGRRLIDPLVSKVQRWNTSRPAAKAPGAGNQASIPPGGISPRGETGAAANAHGRGPEVTVRTPHAEIARRLLTERTQLYLYADLRQLVPAYNLMASRQGLPPQREISEAFRKSYGAVIDGFDHLSFLQADNPEEFLFILTSASAADLENVIGQPERPLGRDGRPRPQALAVGGRELSAVRYEPQTLLLGSRRTVARAITPSTGPPIREAASMFPETAHRSPGALILVKRVNFPGAPAGGPDRDGVRTAFETIVTNLFTAGGPSTLTLVRNPEVAEKAFVDAAQPAIREQAAALAPALGADPALFATLQPGDIQLTLNEATLALPGGEAMIHSALESLARSFEKATPSIQSILQAQDAVIRFNSARNAGAAEALKAASPREALELLNEGIRGSGRFSGATFQFRTPPQDMEKLSALLAIDPPVGLVYRPDRAALDHSVLDLAVTAGHYRNAELLISLWQQAGLSPVPGESTASAVRRILAWTGTPGGKACRSMLGLPELTPGELNGALGHLDLTHTGSLDWKPDGKTYRSWVREVRPDPLGDASRVAATYNAAAAAGAIPASARTDLKTAVSLILQGVTGRGEYAGTTFKMDGFTESEIRSATALLKLENGRMEVTAAPAPGSFIGF